MGSVGRVGIVVVLLCTAATISASDDAADRNDRDDRGIDAATRRILVLPLDRSDDSNFLGRIATATERTIADVLRFNPAFSIVGGDVVAEAQALRSGGGSYAEVADAADADDIVFGSVVGNPDAFTVSVSVFDRYEGRVVQTEQREVVSAANVGDLYAPGDEIVLALAEVLTGGLVRFGSIRISINRDCGDFTVILGGEVVGTNVRSIPRVPSGPHRIRIVQERPLGTEVILDESVDVPIDGRVQVTAVIPAITDAERGFAEGLLAEIGRGGVDSVRGAEAAYERLIRFLGEHPVPTAVQEFRDRAEDAIAAAEPAHAWVDLKAWWDRQVRGLVAQARATVIVPIDRDEIAGGVSEVNSLIRNVTPADDRHQVAIRGSDENRPASARMLSDACLLMGAYLALARGDVDAARRVVAEGWYSDSLSALTRDGVLRDANALLAGESDDSSVSYRLEMSKVDRARAFSEAVREDRIAGGVLLLSEPMGLPVYDGDAQPLGYTPLFLDAASAGQSEEVFVVHPWLGEARTRLDELWSTDGLRVGVLSPAGGSLPAVRALSARHGSDGVRVSWGQSAGAEEYLVRALVDRAVVGEWSTTNQEVLLGAERSDRLDAITAFDVTPVSLAGVRGRTATASVVRPSYIRASGVIEGRSVTIDRQNPRVSVHYDSGGAPMLEIGTSTDDGDDITFRTRADDLTPTASFYGEVLDHDASHRTYVLSRSLIERVRGFWGYSASGGRVSVGFLSRRSVRLSFALDLHGGNSLRGEAQVSLPDSARVPWRAPEAAGHAVQATITAGADAEPLVRTIEMRLSPGPALSTDRTILTIDGGGRGGVTVALTSSSDERRLRVRAVGDTWSWVLPYAPRDPSYVALSFDGEALTPTVDRRTLQPVATTYVPQPSRMELPVPPEGALGATTTTVVRVTAWESPLSPETLSFHRRVDPFVVAPGLILDYRRAVADWADVGDDTGVQAGPFVVRTAPQRRWTLGFGARVALALSGTELFDNPGPVYLGPSASLLRRFSPTFAFGIEAHVAIGAVSSPGFGTFTAELGDPSGNRPVVRLGAMLFPEALKGGENTGLDVFLSVALRFRRFVAGLLYERVPRQDDWGNYSAVSFYTQLVLF